MEGWHMQNALFYGSCVALVTPFSDGKVDFEAFEKLIDWQIDSDTDAILALGTTGEPATIRRCERAELIERAVSRVAGRVPVWVGTGTNDTSRAVQLSREAQALGADALLVVTPYYNRASRQGLIEHYFTIADQVEIPIIVYNVPSRTGVNLTPDTFAELLKHPMICGIKEASGDIRQMTELARVCRGGVAMYAGNDDQAYTMLALGARGVVSVAANVIPTAMHDLVMAYLRCDTELSLEMQFAAMDLISALFSEVSPIPVKAALARMGRIRNELRLPLSPLGEAETDRLFTTMDVLSLLV